MAIYLSGKGSILDDVDMMKKELTQERLKEVLDYDPKTGIFTNKIWRGNRANIGERAGYVGGDTDTIISIDGIRYHARRLAWLYTHGQLLSHGTGATRQYSNNTSGVKGVSWMDSRNQWQAYIRIKNKQIPLGRSKDFAEAVKLRWEAEKRHGIPGCCVDSTAYKYLIKKGHIDEPVGA